MDDKLTNCICNTKLTDDQAESLASIVENFTMKRAICEQFGHQWVFWMIRFNVGRDKCSTCGIIRVSPGWYE